MTKKLRKPAKMYTLKWIGRNCYVYTWKYIKKAEREKAEQRYKWYSLGPYNLELLSELENMSIEEQKQMKLNYTFEWYQREFIENKINELSLETPFKERYEQIAEIEDDYALKEQMSKELRKDLKQQAKRYCDEAFEGFTPETFNDYLNKGGSIQHLLK